MLRLSKPQVWNVYLPNNAELEHEVHFEVYLLSVADVAGISEDLGEWNMFRFYNLQTYLREKNKSHG